MNVPKLLQNKSIKNAGWLIVGRVAEKVIAFVVGLWSANYLGPSNQGLISYAGAYTSFFMALCTLGINSVVVKELIEHQHEHGTVLGTAMLLKMLSSLLSVGMILGISCVVDKGEPTTILVVALCSIGLLLNVLETFHYWFQSRLQSKVTAIAVLVGYAISSGYKILLLIWQKPVEYFALATSIDYLFVGAFQFIAYKKFGGARLRFSAAYGRQLLRRSAPFILPALMVAIYGQTDKFMLKQMLGEEANGYYSTAANFCVCWCFILSAIIDSVTPTVFEANKQHDEALFNRRNKQLYAIVFYLSLFVSLCFTLLAKPLISVLYPKYPESVNPLRVICWYVAFSYLGVARNAWLVCKDRQKYLIFISLSAAVVNFGLNLLLIPKLGPTGAAIASLIAQIATVIVPAFIKPLRENAKLMLDAILLKGVFRVGKESQNG